MSLPGSPTASVHSPSISAEALAAAAEQRTQQSQLQGGTAAQLAAEHERRQQFRRLLDPGITRPNSKERASSSLKTLLTISENLLRESDNPRYHQFKPTNTVIKRDLIETKGALEFAIELGFRPEVKDFQPYYVFHRRHMDDLRIGAAILKEYIDVETSKQERAERSKQNEKAARDAAALRVKLAYMDDRKNKELRDEMERQQRESRAAKSAAAVNTTSTSSRSRQSSEGVMPGSGHILNSTTDNEEDPDEPPVYEVRS